MFSTVTQGNIDIAQINLRNHYHTKVIGLNKLFGKKLLTLLPNKV